MAHRRGFVRDIVARDDGWVEVVLVAVHGGNGASTCYVRNLDGDLTQAHRRLSQLGLLRDALARTLPVEVSTETDDAQGEVVVDVTIHPTASIEGRHGGGWVTGVVVGLGVLERGPEADASPYTDVADQAVATVLLESGSVEAFRVDLQRPHPGTGQALHAMLAEGRRTRRSLRLQVVAEHDAKGGTGAAGAWIVGCGWPTLGPAELDERVVFVERIGERSESWDAGAPEGVARVRVAWRTAPEQHPEGDVSENGTFAPQSEEGWVHPASVLLPRLVIALREGLQVRLGLGEGEIHSVELACPLGSAARPVWVSFGAEAVCDEPGKLCVSEPTVAAPSSDLLDAVPHAITWKGSAWFAKGIWRFAIRSGSPVVLLVDGEEPCVAKATGAVEVAEANVDAYRASPKTLGGGGRVVAHAYLDGLHRIELRVRGRTCSTPFQASIYRIR